MADTLIPRAELARLAFRMARAALPGGWYGTIRGAPGDWSALQVAAARLPGCPLPVYSGGSGATIYGSPAANIAFRAWHDATHVRLGADFSRDGEVRTAREQVAQARAAGASAAALACLWMDTFGQVEYFAAHGTFPVDQVAFVRAALLDGVPAAVAARAGA